MPPVCPTDPAALEAFRRRNEYVEQHLPLVDQIARKLARRTPPNIELDDLIQAGRIGLLSAASRYTRALNVPFGAYARKRIEGEMRELVRRKNNTFGRCEELPEVLPHSDPAPEAIERRRTVVSILSKMPVADAQALTEHFLEERRGAMPERVAMALRRAQLGAGKKAA
jgi:RNA polymerase sigma factor for flagellar operon FliA